MENESSLLDTLLRSSVSGRRSLEFKIIIEIK